MATTTNLGLHQWQAGDCFLKTGFYEHFWKIDGVMLRCISGEFTGDNTVNREIVVGFKPKLLLIRGASGSMGKFQIVGEQAYFQVSNSGALFSGGSAVSGYVFTGSGFALKIQAITLPELRATISHWDDGENRPPSLMARGAVYC